MNFTEVNEEVLFTSEPITNVSGEDIAFLKTKAAGNRRKRVRLCAHSGNEDPVHEMLIVHTKDTYVRPHKHLDLTESPVIFKKSESIHLIEGTLKVLVFDESGDILEVTDLGDYSTGQTFFYRISDDHFHTLIPTSDVVVFHETTKGPFRREDTLFAPWAPAESDAEAQSTYLARLAEQIARVEVQK